MDDTKTTDTIPAEGSPDTAAGSPAPSPKKPGTPRRRLSSVLPRRQASPPAGTARESTTKATVKAVRVDISEGLSMLYGWFGTRLREVPPDPRRPGLQGFGTGMVYTAPTTGRLLAKGLKRFPLVYNLAAVFLGAGSSAIDTTAAVMIPVTIAQMQQQPQRIPELLPRARTFMRPILRDMLTAAKEQKKIEEELATLQVELGQLQGGAPFDLDHLILVEMAGCPAPMADRIIARTEPIEDILRDYMVPVAAPEPVEAVA